MHKFIVLLILVCSINSWSSEKPFQRALLMPGGGFNVATYIGVAEAMRQKGKPVDLFIGACGGAITASLFNLYPDNTPAILDLIRSREFYDIAYPIEVDAEKNNMKNVLFGITGQVLLKRIGLEFLRKNRHKAVNKNWIIRFPRSFDEMEGMNKPLLPNPHSASIIMASLVDPAKGRNSVHEVIMTDEVTAEHVRERYTQSGVYNWKPRSFLNPEVIVDTESLMTFGVRISSTDPFVFNMVAVEPANDDQKWTRRNPYSYYMGAVTNLYPWELAESLAGNIVTVFKKGDAKAWSNMVDHYLNFTQNERLLMTYDKELEAVVDFTDEWDELGSNMPEIKTRWLSPNRFLEIPNQLSYDEWLFRVDQSYEWGYQRGVEAVEKMGIPTRERLKQMNNLTKFNQPKKPRKYQRRPGPPGKQWRR